MLGAVTNYPMQATPLIRFAITKIDPSGLRVLATANQGRNFHDSEEAAQAWLNAVTENTSPSTLEMLWGDISKVEVRPVDCYPNGDAVQTVFGFDPPQDSEQRAQERSDIVGDLDEVLTRISRTPHTTLPEKLAARITLDGLAKLIAGSTSVGVPFYSNAEVSKALSIMLTLSTEAPAPEGMGADIRAARTILQSLITLLQPA